MDALNRKKICKFSIILSIIVTFSSCSWNRYIQDDGVSYSGIGEQVGSRKLGALKTSKHDMHIIITHGMGHSGDTDSFTRLILNLNSGLENEKGVTITKDRISSSGGANDSVKSGDYLKLNPRSAAFLNRKLKSKTLMNFKRSEAYPNHPVEVSMFIQSSYVVRDSTGNPIHKIHYYWIDYSWVMQILKYGLITNDKQLWSNSKYLLNKTLKKKVMNNGFPDAVAYKTPEVRKFVQGIFRHSFDRVITNHEKGESITFFSSSLGSKVMIDSLLGGSGELDLKYNQIIDDAQHFFMFANQIPLLSVGEQEIAIDRLAKSQIKRAKIKNRDPLVVVAFSDPSDLLSYHISSERYLGDSRLKVTNVQVSNRSLALCRLVKNPGESHSNYKMNPYVLDRVIKGNKDSELMRKNK